MFDHGKLVEMGTHSELMQIEGGKYSHLYRLQSDGYADMAAPAGVTRTI
jgi:ABC-type multidrug transport system fused ATPase/permease subunit